MFRRSLAVFVGLAVLVLFLTVGYALLGLSGPESVIAEAEAELAADEPLAAIATIRQVERSLGVNAEPELRERVLRVRAMAYLRRGNYRHAISSLEQLADVYAREDTEIQEELVRALIQVDDSESAANRVRKFLAGHPGHPRGLELAGEALQASYQASLRALLAELNSVLPPRQLEEARDALRPYLYRSSPGPIGREGKRRFDEIVEVYRQGAQVAGLYTPKIDQVRRLMRQAQGYYRQSLAAGGEPVAAYQGLAYALIQGRRLDDAIALARVYQQRFDHIYTVHAALDLARVHLQAGRAEAAEQAARQFLQAPGWREELIPDGLPALPAVRALLLCLARAVRARGATDELPALVALVEEIEQQLAPEGLDLQPEAGILRAYSSLATEAGAGVEAALAAALRHADLRAQPVTGEDLLHEAMLLRLDAAAEANRGVGFSDWIYRSWMEAAPEAVDPYRHRVELLLVAGQGARTLPEAAQLLQRAGHDERALELYAQVVDLTFGTSSRDASSLLQQAIELDGAVPRNVADDALYIQLAQRALDANRPDIALDAARRAAQLFPWARGPRQLWAEAARRMGDEQEVARVLETLYEYHPGNAEILQQLVDARAVLGLPIDDLLHPLALSGARDARLAAALVRRCVQRRDWRTARQLATRLTPKFGRDPEVLVAVSDALAGAGDRALAKRLLLPMFQTLFADDPAQAAPVAKRYLLLAANSRDQRAVQDIVSATVELHRADAASLLEMAQVLERNQLATAAAQALQPVLETAEHAAARTGAVYLLAGRIALALGRPLEAEERLTAALAFTDGGAASRPLALLLLRQGRDKDAAEAFWEDRVSDLADAATFVRLGRTEPVLPWIDAALRSNVADLYALCLRAVLQPDAKVPAAIRELADAAGPRLAELIAYCGEPGFERDGRALATELRAEFPDSEAAALLLAHATDRSGDPELALEQLESIVTTSPDFVAAHNEIVRILTDHAPERLEQPAMVQRINAVVARNHQIATPSLRARALRNMAGALADVEPGSANIAALANLWQNFPQATDPGLEEVELLVRFGQVDAALDLLDLLDQRTSGEDRDEFVSEFGLLAQRLLAEHDQPALRTALLRRARKMIASDGPFGALVHLTLRTTRAGVDQGTAEPSDTDKAAEIALLNEHLALFATRRDPHGASVARTLWRLATLESPTAALQQLDQLLRGDPSLIDGWKIRALLLEREGRDEEAAASLRWLLQYYDGADALLVYSRIVGRAGICTPEDLARLQRDLDAGSAETPAAALALGLLQLRVGSHEEAARLLAEAADDAFGTRLYYLAQALLALNTAEARSRAKLVLEEFVERYPFSPLSEIADNLASQLELTQSAH